VALRRWQRVDNRTIRSFWFLRRLQAASRVMQLRFPDIESSLRQLLAHSQLLCNYTKRLISVRWALRAERCAAYEPKCNAWPKESKAYSWLSILQFHEEIKVWRVGQRSSFGLVSVKCFSQALRWSQQMVVGPRPTSYNPWHRSFCAGATLKAVVSSEPVYCGINKGSGHLEWSGRF